MAHETEDVSFGEAFAASDATKRHASVPEDLPIDWIRDRVEETERILRLQFAPDELPPWMQMQLASCRGDSPEALVERWHVVSHLLRSHRDGLQGRGQPGEMTHEKREAMRKLLTCEPVTVPLEHRTVEVTDRSFACLQEIGRHYMRIIDLQDELKSIQDRRDALQGEIHELDDDPEGRAQLRARLHELREEADLRLKEMRLQRRALYAHLFTDDGRPATSLEQAPEFWREIGPVDEVLLIQAAHEAGPDRLDALGPQPDRPDQDKNARPLEDFGYMTVLARYGVEAPEDPAAPFQHPLGQQIALRRAGAEPVWED